MVSFFALKYKDVTRSVKPLSFRTSGPGRNRDVSDAGVEDEGSPAG